MEKLAIHGGTPVRSTYKVANPQVTDAAKSDVLKVLEAGSLASFYGGTKVRKFEHCFANWFGNQYGVAVNSGTSALHVAYLASGIEEFSEVLVPANAYISAISALIQCNLVPIIVDIDPKSWVMDPNDVKRKITQRTRAIVPVHMYGQPCPMNKLIDIARDHNLVVIEDCGQSHGGLWDDRLTGTFGLAACFSICCRKHVTTGEGGVVITNSKSVADRARSLAHKGKGSGWFDYHEMGFSYNLTEMQAVLGLHGLSNLTIEVKKRQSFAVKLRNELEDLELQFPFIPLRASHAYFKFNFLLPSRLTSLRNEIVKALRCENVGADPCHPYVLTINWLRQQKPTLYSIIKQSNLPNYSLDTCLVAADVLSRQIGLELGPNLETEDIDYTIKAVRKVIGYYNRNL